ncbi:hypothetical protein PLCT1_02096 [Planctomycetaceae bacterium]|nr:hypothetical protein PLCT1_02096 [Planctomycetaceae bacterium]
MRASLLVVGLVVVAACGGGDSPSEPQNPPPPPPPPVAASITVHAGDAQTAEPGALLGVRPAVIVRDASNRPVAGAVVSFVIDSGGGTVSTPSVTAGASGVAEAGDWRLGVIAGHNVLRASSGTLTPVKFRASGQFPSVRQLLGSAPMPQTGGTLVYTRPGDPLSGVTVTVPDGAYPTSTTWTVTADSTIPVPLPPDFSLASPVYSIGNGQGYADSLLEITLPIRAAPDEVVAPFFFDQATGHLEGIELIARTDTSATFGTYHVAAQLVPIPGVIPTAFRTVIRVASAAAVPFGDVKMVFVKLSQAKLLGTFTSSFRPGTDDWEFINYGDYQGHRGNCWGMSAMAMYYHYFLRASGAPPLFGRYDHDPQNPFDNVDGIHLVGAAQVDMSVRMPITQQQRDQIKLKAQGNGMRVSRLTDTWILLNLKLTQRPVMIQLYGASGAHAVVAYEATSTANAVSVAYADPNTPGAGRTMTFHDGVLTPLQLRPSATDNPHTMTEATAFGLSSYVTMNHLHLRWADFVAKHPGQYWLPKPQLQVFDSLSGTWAAMGDTVRLAADTLKMRARCDACALSDQTQGVPLVDAVITNEAGAFLDGGQEAWVHIPEGEHRLFAMAQAPRVVDGDRRFLDGRPIVVIRGKLRLFPLTLTGKADTAYTFTASTSGLAGPTWKFVWNFGDGTAVQTVTGDSVKTHTFTTGGTFTVTVEVRDPANTLVAKTTSTVTIVTGEKWRITSFAERSYTNTLPGSHQASWIAGLVQSYRLTEWELRDSLLARPGGGIIEVRAANAPALARYYHPNDFTILFDWLMALKEPNGTAAMYLTFPRGPSVLAGLLGTTGFPAFVPGFGFGFPRNPVNYVNTFVKGTGATPTYTGRAAVKALGTRTSSGTQPSPVMMVLEIDATTLPDGSLAGTLSFVGHILCSEGAPTFLPCLPNPIVGEVRRVYDFTAARQ